MPGLLQHMQKAICGAMTPDTAVYLLMKAELMRHLCHSESCPCKTSVTGVHHFLVSSCVGDYGEGHRMRPAQAFARAVGLVVVSLGMWLSAAWRESKF